MEGWKLLLVMALQADGRTVEGDPILVVDSLGAGRGETVMITSDGIGARELLGDQHVAGPLVRFGNSRPMTPTAEIDRVVREVLAELTTASAPAPVQPKSPVPVPTIPSNSSELVLASRLVTMNEVAGRLAGVRRLVRAAGNGHHAGRERGNRQAKYPSDFQRSREGCSRWPAQVGDCRRADKVRSAAANGPRCKTTESTSSCIRRNVRSMRPIDWPAK